MFIEKRRRGGQRRPEASRNINGNGFADDVCVSSGQVRSGQVRSGKVR